MTFKINISYLLVVLTIFACVQCDRRLRTSEIRECIKGMPADICIKMHKGI
jgi:hypothetical protein